MASFVFRILPPAAAFWDTLEPGEVTLLVRYLEHLQRLRQGGSMRFVTRSQAHKCAFMLVEADDEAHAKTIAMSDPAVSEGLLRLELHAPWSMRARRLRSQGSRPEPS